MKARNPNTGNLETIYVKALDSLPVGSEIDVEDGSDIPVGWEEVEDKGTVYSTTEQRVGTWIDGKPIYEKTINFGTLPDNSSKDVAHGISNLKRVIDIDFSFYSTTGVHINFKSNGINPSVGSNVNGILSYVTWQNVHIYTSATANTYSGYVTMKYTKTTD